MSRTKIKIIHYLKCWPTFFAAHKSGVKTCEVRFNDRDYKVGDVLALREWKPTTRKYVSDRVISRKVTHMLPEDKEGYVVMSLLNLEHEAALRNLGIAKEHLDRSLKTIAALRRELDRLRQAPPDLNLRDVAILGGEPSL